MQNKQANNREKLYSCIRQVREGDQAAFAALLTDYEPLIGAQVAHHGADLSAQDVEDLRQSALIAFYRAALNFDLSQSEVEFGLYAKVCISNALVSQLRVIRRYHSEISVGDTWLHSQGEDPTTRLMEEEAAAALFARVRALLSPFENRVWSLYVAGRPVREIARLLQKDPHSIENAVYRIRKKLRSAFEDGLRD